MADSVGAVILGGDFQALGALRSFARKKIPLVLLDGDLNICRFSRYKKRIFKAPSIYDEDAYLSFLIALAAKESIHGWVLIPNNDMAVYILSKYKDTLEHYYKVPAPTWDVLKYIHIKKRTYEIAAKNSITIPETHTVEDERDLLSLNLRFPLVVKPSIKDHFYRRIKKKAFKANNKNELVDIYRLVASIIPPSEILIQDFIPGGARQLYSYCPFFKNGSVLCGIAARRTRQHPMDFGQASTYAEIVSAPELKEIAEHFLSIIGYYGIAEVEFMKDPRDNQYKLIEVNPRIWGWHTLAIAAGIDLPYFLYLDMLGKPVERFQPSQNGLRWMRLITDIPTVLSEIAKGNMRLTEYLASLKGKKEFAVFSIDDPLPFLIEIALIPYLWAKRGF